MTDKQTPTTTDDITSRLDTVETQYESIKVQLGEISQVLETVKTAETKPENVDVPTVKVDSNEPVFQKLYENEKAGLIKLDKDIDFSKLDKIDIPSEKKIEVLKSIEQIAERTNALILEVAVLKKEPVKTNQSLGGSTPNVDTPDETPGLTGAEYLAKNNIDIQSIKEHF